MYTQLRHDLPNSVEIFECIQATSSPSFRSGAFKKGEEYELKLSPEWNYLRIQNSVQPFEERCTMIKQCPQHEAVHISK